VTSCGGFGIAASTTYLPDKLSLKELEGLFNKEVIGFYYG